MSTVDNPRFVVLTDEVVRGGENQALASAYSQFATLDYDALVENATASVNGFRLVQKAALVDVPFVIVGITYRDGITREERSANYLSVECVVASERVLKDLDARHVIQAESLAVSPNEQVVFNDGGTGVARQLTQFLHMQRIIDVGPLDNSNVGGPMGASAFDRYVDLWYSGKESAIAGIHGTPLLMVPRGLRSSEYEFGNTDAVTYYLG